jgi:anaerobic ribonucleoside-triphosphate reductase activating protein
LNWSELVSWLNLASWIPCTEVEGPGKRAALWVQGCDKRCVGCCNPDYLKIVEREILKAEAMVDRLLEAQAEWGLEGVTFLGGEPFLQAQGLAVVAEGVSRDEPPRILRRLLRLRMEPT